MNTDGEDSVEGTADHREPKNLIRSQYKDIMVKIDEDIYYLDRLQLALNSEYFEKLFIDDFSDKNYDLIEIPVMDTDTFSLVVDIIYGQELDSVINTDNYVSLLMAMDYLQIDFDSRTYQYFLRSNLRDRAQILSNNNLFKLFHFIAENVNYEYLLPIVFKLLSRQLANLQYLDEFLSISFDHFIKIILQPKYNYCDEEILALIKICTKWICHDVENRLPHTIDLVNAAKFRFCFLDKILREDLKIRLPANDEHINQDTVSRYFCKLLMYSGEVCCSGDDELDEDEQRKFNRKSILCIEHPNQFEKSRPKLITFLRNSYFYDVTVKADEKIFKLHRSVLKSASSYFDKIFSIEYSDLISQCEGIPNLPSKDKIYVIDEISSTIFDIIIHHIYVGEVEFTSDIIVSLFKAAHILKISSLLKPCCSWMEVHSKNLCIEDVIEILNFTHRNIEYKNLNRFFLYRYLIGSLLEIDNLPHQFTDFLESNAPPKEIGRSNENKVHLFDKTDLETLGLIFYYKYFEKVKLTLDNVMRVLKASEFFKMEKLMEECAKWLIQKSKEIRPKDIIEVISFTRRNIGYEHLNRVFLSKYFVNSWPEIDNLPQFAAIFEAISYSEEIKGHSNENKVYLFDKVDQETFRLVFDYIYFDELELALDNVVRVLKASEVFKMEKLMKKCVDWLTKWKKEISAKEVTEVIGFAHRNIEYKALNTVYLSEYMIEWPQVDNSLFCSISYDCLENLLMSTNFHVDDPHKILDICSKWVIHDTENRYCLIPRIALAISRNRMVDCDDYSIASPPDFNHYSQDFVKDELWKILSSTLMLPSEILSESKIKKPETQQPVFITSNKTTKNRKFRILNADWDEIASFCITKNVQTPKFPLVRSDWGQCSYFTEYAMSATMINDNLFILCTVTEKTFFYAYNLSSKKLFSLASDSRIFNLRNRIRRDPFKYTLLSCSNEIYCCIEDGEILKYSFELNRWMKFSAPQPDKDPMCFTSDGKLLYRMFKVSRTNDSINYTIEAYNSEQSSWICSNLPVLVISVRHHIKEHEVPIKLTFLKSYGFVVLFRSISFYSNYGAPWENVLLPPDHFGKDASEERSTISQHSTEGMLYVLNNNLYSYHRSRGIWQLKNDWPFSENKYGYLKKLNYGNIIAIHRT